ncbi:protein GAPT [Dromiciops gliroides]|uniref:protein GAPT n=1 Tax=Dromiciops gliroides TaxID=33562 RepID=UPI001CC38912|nr:protein GAPT [Dromiciops gliroides]
MTDHLAFFFLHFLLCHLHPSLSTSHCKFVENKVLQWVNINRTISQLYLNNCDVKKIEFKDISLPELKLLNLSYNQIETLPEGFLFYTQQNVALYLDHNKLNDLPHSILQNNKLQLCSLDCISAVIKNLHEWSNITTCKDIFKNCGDGLGYAPLIVPLLLAILVLCALGLAWYWKRYRYTSNFALPRFLHKKRVQHESDPQHTLCTPTEYTGPKCFSLYQIKEEPSLSPRDGRDQSYENVETGPVNCAKECLTDLYENTTQFNSEEHLYGNESSPEYYNFQNPHFLNTPSDEDIYVLPD